MISCNPFNRHIEPIKKLPTPEICWSSQDCLPCGPIAWVILVSKIDFISVGLWTSCIVGHEDHHGRRFARRAAYRRKTGEYSRKS
jgi:hypothetical protein